MRWPDWTERFRHCCGLCEGPHNEHYDAWLARERLAQVKRLETKLADLSKENAVLSGQLGQAVSVLDSYHSFDMDAIAANDPMGAAGLQAENRSDSSRNSQTLGSRSQDGLTPAYSGRLSNVKPPSASSGRLASANRISRKALMAGTAMPTVGSRGSGRLGSLQAQPAPRQWQAATVTKSSTEDRRISTDSSATIASSTAVVPPYVKKSSDPLTSAEIDALLARKSRRERPVQRPTQPLPQPTASTAPQRPATSAEPARIPVRTIDLQRASSAQLPTVASLAAMPTPQPLPMVPEASDSARSSESFEFPTPQMSPPTVLPVAPATMVAPRIGIMQGPTAQPVPQMPAVPVLDPKMLAHQARGQVYSGHYSPETSPFARAAARMPKPPSS